MKISRLAGLLLLALAVSPILPGQQSQPRKKRLLAVGASKGFQHDSISYALGTLWKLGNQSGLWETYIRTDTELITKKKLDGNAKNLDYFDAVYFYTTGELNLDEEQKAALLSFVRVDGKGFIGGHSAADTLYRWPEYGDMIGAYFDLHPWHQSVRVRVEDRRFPATRHFPPSIEITDEIYQFKAPYSRDKVRVLMSVDPSSVDLKAKMVHRTDRDFALAWVKEYGKGRVFFNALGHENQVYDRPDIQRMILESVKWVMGLTEGDANPQPRAADCTPPLPGEMILRKVRNHEQSFPLGNRPGELHGRCIRPAAGA